MRMKIERHIIYKYNPTFLKLFGILSKLKIVKLA